MSSRDEARIRELQDALATLQPREWSAFLERECGADVILREEVLRRYGEATRQRQVTQQESIDQALLSTVSNDAADQPRAPILQAGQNFGSYRIVRLLGRGGMGEVYEADHVDSGQRLALKVLNAGFITERDRRRFLREGQLAAALSHPNTVYVFGSEEIQGIPVITMELVRGGTLSDRVKTSGPLSTTEAVDAILHVIGGLRAASELGILHRDVKPSNCFISEDGHTKVGDFGVSISLAALDRTRLTANGSVLGTPAFAAPEQLRGEELDERADIYAVGATLFFLLCARPPFDADDAVHLIAQALSATPTAPHLVRPDIPHELSRLVLSCLAKDRDQRPPTYAALEEAFEPFSSSGPQYAALVPRTVAAIIDGLVLWTLGGVMGTMVGWPIGWTQAEAAVGRILAQMVIGAAYFVVTEGMSEASLGKRLCGLRVARTDFARLTVGRAIVRSAIVVITIRLLPLIWALTEFREPYAPDVGLEPRPLDLFIGVVGLLLFVRARPWNGWRGLHEFASGTSTIRQIPETARRAPAQALTPIGTSNADHFVGPFRVVSSFPDDPTTVLGHDERLRRYVWIRFSFAAGPVGSRRDLDRPLRFRWLAGRHTGGEHWDAYEYIDGQPWLLVHHQVISFQVVAQWLERLSRECRDGSSDGTLEVIATNRLWLTRSGDLKVTDWRLPGLDSEAPVYAPAETSGCQQFLTEVADHALSLSGQSASACPIPLSGGILLTNLREGSFESLDAVVNACGEAAVRPSDISPSRRAALLAIPVMLALAVWTVEIGVSIERQRARTMSHLESCLRQLWSVERGLSVDRSADPQRAAALCVSLFSRGLNVRTAMESARLIPPSDASFEDATALIESARTRYPRASSDDLRLMTHNLPSGRFIERDLPLLSGTAFVWRITFSSMSGSVTPLLMVIGLACILSSTLFGVAPLYRALEVGVADRNGNAASRVRLVARSLVIWLPVITVGFMGFVLASAPWITVGAAAVGAMVLAAIYGVRHPHRGLAERLTNTVLVRR
jgi:uncharacterized RDD family membrane protein YckC